MASKTQILHTPRGRVHRHTLIEVNISVFTGRRDAAHSRVLEVLRRELMARPRPMRENLYAFCHWLLEEAIRCTRRSQVQTDLPVLHYLDLLQDTIVASEGIVRHELTLRRERAQFADILNEYVVSQLQASETDISDAEKNLFDTISDVLLFGEPVVAADTQSRMERFRGDDQRRYDLALAEYERWYETLFTEVLTRGRVPASC